MTTVREDIVRWVVQTMRDMRVGEPPSNPYNTRWSVVTRRPVTEMAKGKRTVLGVFEGSEVKVNRVHPITDATLSLILEFHVLVSKNEEQAHILSVVMGDIQRRMREDPTAGGLALDILEDRNETDIEGLFDRTVSGAVSYSVRYRHHTDDPSKQV